jgi:pimeloyl-ACP methyl ester carboxylesterase
MTEPTRISTSHGTLAYEEYGVGSTEVLFIHGNSSCRKAFRHQQGTSFYRRYRMISFDLPGHGDSENSPDPERTYTLSGFADATLQLISALDLKHLVVVGWSLGGHIAVELMARYPKLQGLLLSGSPPIGKMNGVNDFSAGFAKPSAANLAGKEVWTDDDAASFVHHIFRGSEDQDLVNAAKRADGRFRRRIFEASREGMGVNQREVVQASRIPIGVINGAEDSIVNLDYFDTVDYKYLWSGMVHRLPGVGHAPFWQDSRAFNALLGKFLSNISH